MSAAESRLTVRLPWQLPQWQRLSSLHSQERLPHALLLHGPPGVGKQQFALALAHYLMCEQPESGTACGHCRQCGFNRAGTHPDLKSVTPEEPGKAIKIDQVRELVEFLGRTAQQGGLKVTLVQPAEALNTNAANALLKSLEEPAGDTLLMLIADAPGRLLPTIRSRCQAVGFQAPEAGESSDWLASRGGIDLEEARAVLAETRGQPLTALELLQNDGLAQLRQLDADYVGMLEGRLSPLAVAERWQAQDFARVLDWLSRRLGELVSAAVAGTPLAEPWSGWAERVDPRALYALLDEVYRVQQQWRQGANPNRQLALEGLMLASCDKFHT